MSQQEPRYDILFGEQSVFGPPCASDHRVRNPGLHMLYTKTGVDHIGRLMNAIDDLQSCSNLNMTEPVTALQLSLLRLVCWNTAYTDAWEIYLTTIRADQERYFDWIGMEDNFRQKYGLPRNTSPHTTNWLNATGGADELLPEST